MSRICESLCLLICNTADLEAKSRKISGFSHMCTSDDDRDLITILFYVKHNCVFVINICDFLTTYINCTRFARPQTIISIDLADPNFIDVIIAALFGSIEYYV